MLSSPMPHGDVGFLDELALIACIVIVFVALVALYVIELRKSTPDTTQKDSSEKTKLELDKRES